MKQLPRSVLRQGRVSDGSSCSWVRHAWCSRPPAAAAVQLLMVCATKRCLSLCFRGLGRGVLSGTAGPDSCVGAFSYCAQVVQVLAAGASQLACL